MRRHPLCADCHAGQGQHLPLPDVPEGVRIAMREFCADCGTPLSFRRVDGPRIEIMTGAFDRPDRVIPTRQYGTESRLGWVVGISNLPSHTTMQNYGPEKIATIVSHQHPDHD
jgi:hypothetical protein